MSSGKGNKKWFVVTTTIDKLSAALVDLEELDWVIWEVLGPESGLYTVICFKWGE